MLFMENHHPELWLHQALHCHEQTWGERATRAQVDLHFGRKMPGPPVNPLDAARHARMAVLIETDPNLVRRRVKEGDHRVLAQAARLAIKENALPSERDENGKPTRDAVDRLCAGFPYFALDMGAGFDRTIWFKD
jgi:hypothetical protein